jgi:hypothetical protein
MFYQLYRARITINAVPENSMKTANGDRRNIDANEQAGVCRYFAAESPVKPRCVEPGWI